MKNRLHLTKEERNGLNPTTKTSPDTLPNNFTLLFQRPNARTNIYDNVVAIGKFKNGEWEFESGEILLKQWLAGIFSQPITSKHGLLQPDSARFVEYINDFVILRKGLTMTAQ